MLRCCRILFLLALFGIPAMLAGPSAAQGLQVVTVAVSPGTVPVGTTVAVKSSVLVTATVSGVPAGSSAACAVTLTLQPSGIVLSAKTVSTSPAPDSGVTSFSTIFTISGGTQIGPAEAAVTCGGSTSFVLFRITSLVALGVSPLSVPAGGILILNLLIATNGPLPFPAQCTIVVTDPGGSAPPLAFQSVSVSGGSASAPAGASTTITLPAASPIGPANAAASCVIQGVGTVGDSVDFAVTDPGQVTLVSPPASVAPGGTLALSAITLPGFDCVAQLTLPDGERVSSAAVTAGATGSVTLSLLVPASSQPGSASLIVVCTDPTNPANSATSTAQTIAVTAAAAGTAPVLPLSAVLTNTAQPLAAGGVANVAISTTPGALCSLSGFLDPSGKEQAISEPTATGSVPALGTVTLSFHVAATAASGTGIIDLGCSAAGAQGTEQVALQIGVAANCAGLSGAPIGSAPPGTTPLASVGGPYSSSAGAPLQFSGSGSQPSAGAVLTSCLWTFGDGQTATGLNPTHTYAAAGSYGVTLSVSDSDGLSAVASTTATVGGFVPLCSQPALTGSAALGACVSGLSCPAASVPGQCLSPCTTLAPVAVALQDACPQPTTTVRIVTGGPYSGQLFQPIGFQTTVSVSGTRRLCSADATLGTAGPFCHLAPAVTLPTPISYSWDFGDGSTGDGAATAHAYSTAGTYTVSLTVSFDDGSTASAATKAQIAGAPTNRQIALVAGCNSISLGPSTLAQPGAIAGGVSGARVTAIWAMAPGQSALAWFPDGSAPQNLTAIGGGGQVWVCVDAPGVVTLPG